MAVHDLDGIGAGPRRSDADQLDAAIGALADLDEMALRRRWRGVIGRPMTEGLGRALALRILAYRLQAQRHGDLDRASIQALAAFVRAPDGPAGAAGGGADAAATKPAPRRPLRPGTILAREHDGKMHRVMALEQGFAWEGRTYESLSKLAFAITGTKWNGPRFFGLRDKAAWPKGGRRPIAPISNVSAETSHVGGASFDESRAGFGEALP